MQASRPNLPLSAYLITETGVPGGNDMGANETGGSIT
jgi:hypothetical protein